MNLVLRLTHEWYRKVNPVSGAMANAIRTSKP
jgi:hypothetical protein